MVHISTLLLYLKVIVIIKILYQPVIDKQWFCLERRETFALADGMVWLLIADGIWFGCSLHI